MTSPYPSTYSPGAGLSPGLPFSNNAPGTPGSTSNAYARPPLSTRPTGSHLHPTFSAKLAPPSGAGSVLGAGSVAATSVYLPQATTEEFERALEEFVGRQAPELEALLIDVLDGIENAFDPEQSPAVTEYKLKQLQATLQQLITTTRQTGIAGIPISSSKRNEPQPPSAEDQLATLGRLATEVERATEACYEQRRTVRDDARAVCEIMTGAGK